jgi:ABC-type nickel/cobalt efflux system permease component RcnA
MGAKYLARAGPPLALVLALAGAAPAARAHPVPPSSHDRVVALRLTGTALVVEYTLQVDQWTVVFEDLPKLVGEVAASRLTRGPDFNEAFAAAMAPKLLARLHATLDGAPLTFTCATRGHQLLDHVSCAFVFQAPWTIRSEKTYHVEFSEGNYPGKPGRLQLSVVADAGIRIVGKTEPAPQLASDKVAEQVTATADFQLAEGEAAAAPAAGPMAEDAPAPERNDAGDSTLVGLFLHSRHGFWLMLLLAVGLGAAHALTPGHGKTLVAAYLVGQRGTVLHALVLGLVTTLTHTGVVLVLALVLWMYYPEGMAEGTRRDLQRVLELVGGLLIAGLGFWLLLRRLAGQADHVHIGGAGHHHHHHHGGHHHHHHHPTEIRPGWGGLITLGVSGGIVPCWDAVALLLAAVAMNLLAWALPLLLAFSAGLAGVLVLIGILVVRTRALAGARWERSRLYRALPLLSAVAVTALGLCLCYSSVHGG